MKTVVAMVRNWRELPRPVAGDGGGVPMSNYRSFYGLPSWADAERLTPRQRRRGARKSERDLLAGGIPVRHPNRGRGLSGNPARRSGREHYLSGGWTGGPGECGAQCVCGVTFDGFDTHAEAAELLDGHVAEERRSQLRGRFARYVAVRRERPAPLPEPEFPSVEHAHRMVAMEPTRFRRRPGQPAWARRFDLVERAR